MTLKPCTHIFMFDTDSNQFGFSRLFVRSFIHLWLKFREFDSTNHNIYPQLIQNQYAPLLSNRLPSNYVETENVYKQSIFDFRLEYFVLLVSYEFIMDKLDEMRFKFTNDVDLVNSKHRHNIHKLRT